MGLVMDAKIDSRMNTLIQSLTLEEKVSLLAGKDFWETVPVPSKGVPAIKVNIQLRWFKLGNLLTSYRLPMDQMAPEVRFSQEEPEPHVFLPPYARLLRGIRHYQDA